MKRKSSTGLRSRATRPRKALSDADIRAAVARGTARANELAAHIRHAFALAPSNTAIRLT